MRDREKYKVLAEKNQRLCPRYRKLHNRVTAELRKSVKTYYQGLIDGASNNPKENLQGSKARKPTRNLRGIQKSLCDPKLASAIQNETTNDPLQYLSAEIPSVMPSFVFQRIDENLVKREVNRLKCSKSPEHDQIPVKAIKDAVEILSKPLATIFNSSMEEGIWRGSSQTSEN